MTRILAIDPGSTQSAWLFLDDGRPIDWGKEPNDDVLELVRRNAATGGSPRLLAAVVIEQIEPRYGLQLGWEVLDTARWVGRFEQAATPLPVVRLRRSEVLRHLGVVTAPRKGEARVSADAGVRAALIDRYGGHEGKAAAIGLKAAPGPLYGITADCWAALAVAVTHADQLSENPR